MSNLKVIQFTLLLILLVTITNCKMRDDQEYRTIILRLERMLKSKNPAKRVEAAGRAEKATEPVAEDDVDEVPEADVTELEFLDDAEMEFFCPECGIKIRLDGDSLPNFCLKCGNKLPVE